MPVGNDTPPPNLVVIDQPELAAKGFTTSGTKQYCDTVIDYAGRLFGRAVRTGDLDKAEGLPAEITHDHVRSSAHSIAGAADVAAPPWVMFTQIGEYIATAAAGVGGGYIKESWGVITFGLGLTVTVLLVLLRLTKGKAA